MMNAEQKRLFDNAQKQVPLEKWGTYLSERQWGTVREDYSGGGDAWSYFPHDHARSRAYLWGEDGIGGISDYKQKLCFALALWNGKDAILKERLFGLTNSEGNHGEDVKELYYYLDNSPTHSYMKFLYKYPFEAFPYEELIDVNRQITKQEHEYEILDTGVFNDNKYHDIYITYAKNNPEDICIKIEVCNRSNENAALTLLPTLWFRNIWAENNGLNKPSLSLNTKNTIEANHPELGDYYLYFQDSDEVFFTENETNRERIFGQKNKSLFVKDAFHEALCENDTDLRNAIKSRNFGTKCSVVYSIETEPNTTKTIYLRLSKEKITNPFLKSFLDVFDKSLIENDAFFEDFLPKNFNSEQKLIQRQAFAGLLWSKQFYYYDIKKWLSSNPEISNLPIEREFGRNSNWKHLLNHDVISMPDTWEYPWYASWDLAFHCVPMGMIDAAFAKNQLILIMREWYMSPNGQVPAYEWNFSDVNPPVQAWSALQIYFNEKRLYNITDTDFLKRMLQKLLINFTWWANREDNNGNNIFSGGFLGLDNIAVIDRSNLPIGYELEQVDATAWMAMYALNMMEISTEIARVDITFEDSITKFYEHFILIANSLNTQLWDENESFFYDLLCTPYGEKISLKVRSVVGISSLFAVAFLEKNAFENLPDFQKRKAFLDNIISNDDNIQTNENGDILLSLLNKDRLQKILHYLLDENEFLSIGGIRALSKFHQNNPFSITIGDRYYNIEYVPGDSDSGMFGGNSNWRGPIWIPINYLIIKSLEKYGKFYGDSFKVEFPTRSGNFMNLKEVSKALSQRLIHIFEADENDKRIVHGHYKDFYKQPENKDLVLFFEYFHGDTARGVGASHQTGWTAVVAELINSL
jgi:hypothetical protein